MSNEILANEIPQDEELSPPDPAQSPAATGTHAELNENKALALLKQADLASEVIEQLAKNAGLLKSRKVKIALVSHPRAPRHISIPLARHFYTFDLMKVTLSAHTPADVKVAVDNVLIARLKTLTTGERLTLARRASGRVAAALLLAGKTSGPRVVKGKMKVASSLAQETRVMRTALENPRLTEALVIDSVLHADAGAALVQAVAHHEKWSRRREIRVALMRSEHLSLARALEFSGEIPTDRLRELLASSRLPGTMKSQLLRDRDKQ